MRDIGMSTRWKQNRLKRLETTWGKVGKIIMHHAEVQPADKQAELLLLTLAEWGKVKRCLESEIWQIKKTLFVKRMVT